MFHRCVGREERERKGALNFHFDCIRLNQRGLDGCVGEGRETCIPCSPPHNPDTSMKFERRPRGDREEEEEENKRGETRGEKDNSGICEHCRRRAVLSPSCLCSFTCYGTTTSFLTLPPFPPQSVPRVRLLQPPDKSEDDGLGDNLAGVPVDVVGPLQVLRQLDREGEALVVMIVVVVVVVGGGGDVCVCVCGRERERVR
jgi:hypothetical protein